MQFQVEEKSKLIYIRGQKHAIVSPKEDELFIVNFIVFTVFYHCWG